MKIKLKSKLLTLFLLIAIVPLAITGLIAYKKTAQSIQTLQYEKLNALADKRVERINELIAERQRDIILLSQSHEFPDTVRAYAAAFAAGGADSPAYQELKHKHGTYLSNYADALKIHTIFIITPEGDVVFTTTQESELGTNLLTDPHKEADLARVFRLAAEGRPVETLTVEYHAVSDEMTAFVATPVMEDGRMAGVLAFQLSIDNLYIFARDYNGLGNTGEMVLGILEGKKILIIAPTRHNPNAALQSDVLLGSNDAKPIQKAAQGESGEGTFTDYRGESVLAAWRYLPKLNLGMVLKIDANEAFAPNQILAKSFGALGAITLLLVFALSLGVARSIANPVRELTRATGQMASGNAGVHVNIQTGDEIEVLATAFNQMAISLDIAHEESKQQDWLDTGIVGLDNVMRGEKELSLLCTDIITYLARHLDVQVGTLSLADRENSQLILASGYAYKQKPGVPTTFRFGEGLIGQAAQEKKQIVINDVPKDYITVTSALGEMVPKSILCAPLLYEDQVSGVVELGSITAFTDLQLQLLDQTTERIAITIHAAQSRKAMKVLLEESQAMTEELQSQQEELEQKNEEFAAQQAELEQGRRES